MVFLFTYGIKYVPGSVHNIFPKCLFKLLNLLRSSSLPPKLEMPLFYSKFVCVLGSSSAFCILFLPPVCPFPSSTRRCSYGGSAPPHLTGPVPPAGFCLPGSQSSCKFVLHTSFSVNLASSIKSLGSHYIYTLIRVNRHFKMLNYLRTEDVFLLFVRVYLCVFQGCCKVSFHRFQVYYRAFNLCGHCK